MKANTKNIMKIVSKKPIGYLEHKPTHSNIAVYKPIGWFKLLMIRWCFGLVFHKYNDDESWI